ncbi:MAG: CHAT domain-containing protein [Sciscionella sp.]|nr:CHAT domain-containing protein [Sciscionella sp.]
MTLNVRLRQASRDDPARRSMPSVTTADAAVRASAEELDAVLMRPIRRLLGDRRIVLVPTSVLHSVPWSALPSCRGRPLSVAPSVACWMRATPFATAKGVPHADGSVWVAGPDLRHAEREVRQLHAAFGGQLLTGERSTVDSVLSTMDCSLLAHIAAHGRFRQDQPLFSAIELADGSLYGYDLQRLTRAPRLLVLTACESGLTADRGGDQTFGLASVALRLGSSAVLASVLPVPDEPAIDMINALYTRLAAGDSPAAALAAAQHEHGDFGFVCLGNGF